MHSADDVDFMTLAWRNDQFGQTFIETCIDFVVACLAIHLVRRSLYRSYYHGSCNCVGSLLLTVVSAMQRTVSTIVGHLLRPYCHQQAGPTAIFRCPHCVAVSMLFTHYFEAVHSLSHPDRSPGETLATMKTRQLLQVVEHWHFDMDYSSLATALGKQTYKLCVWMGWLGEGLKGAAISANVCIMIFQWKVGHSPSCFLHWLAVPT